MGPQRKSRLERLLVASDGEPATDAALRVAKLLAERDGADVEVVSVFCPHIPVPPLASDSAEHRCEAHDRRAVAQLFERVWRQTRDRIGVPWPVSVRTGHPPWMISETATAGRADLVLLGHTASHESGERRTTRHTAEQVSYACDVPVLAVPADVQRLPRSALVVVDGSEASGRAVSMAYAVLARDGSVHETREPASAQSLRLAEKLGADLLCLPLSGQDFAVRSLMGGGVADALDHARCLVLITPTVAKGSVGLAESDSLEVAEAPGARTSAVDS